MNKTPVSTLTGDRLPYWVAKAQKWTELKYWWVEPDGTYRNKRFWEPHINGGQCFELIELLGYGPEVYEDHWYCGKDEYGQLANRSDDAGTAVCRAYIASVFGEFVNEEEG